MSAARRLARDVAEGRVVLVDGGMGTEIEARGVTMDDAAWCALANLDDLDVVQEIHEDYIRAGADVIITNTFSAGRTVLADSGHENDFDQINRRAVTAALRARATTESETLIAGSVGGLPTASDMTFHDRGLSPEQLFRAFNEQAMLLADAGVDLIALEMIGPGGHAEPAVRAALATGLPVWLGLSVLRLVESETDYGDLADPDDRAGFEALVSSLADSRLAAITVMHSSLEQVEPALDLVRAQWQGPIGVYPHVGTFVAPNWHFEDITPEEFAAHARGWVERGARLIGGCCGIRPAHIAALKQGLSGDATGSGSDVAARYRPSA
jgi:S-methylmethionine-dependent homocysteine/selenocysteine methylase